MTAKENQLAAVALAYRQADAAPRVVAKGRGLIAEEIVARAKEHGVFVHDSPDLVGLLMQVNLDDRIPPQLYMAVAELLAWLFSIENGTVKEVNLPPITASALPDSSPGTRATMPSAPPPPTAQKNSRNKQ